MFPVRWRWSAAIALALPRFRGGKKVPAPLARMAAEDLLAAVFPDQLACAENLPGELEIPDHPLVRQTLRDCLEEAMDAGGFERLLRALESGGIQVLARDLTEPSPLALEVLSARPYAYLDDAPLEERRTQAVMSRRWLDPQSAADLGKLDAEAIRRVREEAWPDATDADELHDALLWLTYLTDAEVARGAGWTDLIAQLAAQRRVTHIVGAGAGVWVTAERLRAEIEPIGARDFVRFLLDWQRVTPALRMEGPDAVGAVLAQLEGFEAPASAWETEILPARIGEYEPAWLDEQCLAGRFVWTRLAARRAEPGRGAAPVRSTPIVLLARRNLRFWSSLAGTVEVQNLSPPAQRVAEYLSSHGASFFDEIAPGSSLLPSQAEEALGELVALGLVNSDSFAGLRALLVPADRRRPLGGGRRRRRIALFGMDAAGRWSRIARPDAPARADHGGGEELVEHLVRTLLRRWGVVFWRLLAREAEWLPPWRDLLMCCRRLEARGEIRGGRFVAGFSGEQ